jgi:ankyrin repeat protein
MKFKSEIRNPKSERSPKSEIRLDGRAGFGLPDSPAFAATPLRASGFGFLSDVGFRASGFGANPLLLFVLALVFAFHAGAADVLTERLQRGLFEEEANHNLDAAIKEYQTVVAQSDEQRKVIATALFRLGECYRKLGKTNEAQAQYQRLLRDFSEQEQLVRIAGDLLKPAEGAAGGDSALARELQRRVAALRLERLAQQIEVNRLTGLGREALLKSDVARADAALAELQRQLRAIDQKLAATSNLGSEHPDRKAAEALRKTIDKQIDDVLEGIVIAARSRAASLSKELSALEAELKKAEPAAANPLLAGAGATDEEEKEVRRIQALIKDSPDLINARSGATETPLHRAASVGQLVVARFLLENNADISAKNSQGDTPLHVAANRGHKSMVELLLDHRADVNALSGNGTPLHYAAGSGFRAVVEVLLARGADVNAKTAAGGTPLFSAVGSGNRAVAELLLDKGADVNATTSDGWNGLHMAANAGNKPLVELIVARGARIDARRRDGQTALCVAVLKNSVPVAEVLLAKKASPNIPDNSATTPLSHAVQKASLELVNLLLTHGADPNLGDQNAVMPLHWASLSGEAAIVEALLKNKASPDAKIVWGAGAPPPTYRTPRNSNETIPNGATPLWLAVAHQHVSVADLLLSSGAPVNARMTTTSGGNPSSYTPLEMATGNNNKDMVKLLLDRKANPNVFNANTKMTPLMTASGNRSREIVELLLAHGAEVNVLSQDGYTPLSINRVEWNGRPRSPEIAELLLQHGAIEDLQRAASITVARGELKYRLFQKDTNGLNRFTLFEAVAQHYWPGQQNYLQFPDFAHVRIRPLKSRPGEQESIVDLETAFQFADCARNTWLEWGDLIEIPEQDHIVNVSWPGLSASARESLKQCLRKQVTIVVKGQTNLVVLTPDLPQYAGTGRAGAGMRTLPAAPLPGTIAPTNSVPELTFQRLNDVVRSANVIRSSSDLARVKVKRSSGAPAERQELLFDLARTDKANDLWLRDGDVIEIPDK